MNWQLQDKKRENHKMIIDANSVNPIKSTYQIKIGDIMMTSIGYAKVSCLNPVKAVSITRGMM